MEVRILKFLNAVNPLSEEDCDNLLGVLKTKQLKKGDYWLEEGKMNYNVAFVGYLRRYWIKEGNEITDNFYFENDLCVDLPSIIGRTKPLSNVIAIIEPTVYQNVSTIVKVKGKDVKIDALCTGMVAVKTAFRARKGIGPMTKINILLDNHYTEYMPIWV